MVLHISTISRDVGMLASQFSASCEEGGEMVGGLDTRFVFNGGGMAWHQGASGSMGDSRMTEGWRAVGYLTGG